MATGDTQESLVVDEDDFVKCSLCKRDLIEPKLLPCFHSFCTCCLETYIQEKNKEDRIPCPTCNLEHVVNGNGEIVGIEDNFLFSTLKKESMTDVSCIGCKNEVTHQCTDCGDTMCHVCQLFHGYSSFTKNHKVVKVKEGENFKPTAKIYCKTHGAGKNSTLSHFCETCSDLVCPECIVTNHRNHQYEECYILRARYSMTFSQHLTSLDRPKELVNRFACALEAMIIEMEKVKKLQEDYLCDTACQLHDIVDRIKTEKLIQLEKTYLAELGKMRKNLENANNTKSCFKAAGNFAQLFQQRSQVAEFFNYLKTVQDKIEHVSHLQFQHKMDIKTIKVIAEEEDYMNQMMEKCFGKFVQESATIGPDYHDEIRNREKFASMCKIQKNVTNLVKFKTPCQEVFEWIEENVNPKVLHEPLFIRTLVTSLCSPAVQGSGLHARLVRPRISPYVMLLQRYIDNNPQLEIEALTAIVSIVKTVDAFPSSKLLEQFSSFFHQMGLIPEDAFNRWLAGNTQNKFTKHLSNRK